MDRVGGQAVAQHALHRLGLRDRFELVRARFSSSEVGVAPTLIGTCGRSRRRQVDEQLREHPMRDRRADLRLHVVADPGMPRRVNSTPHCASETRNTGTQLNATPASRRARVVLARRLLPTGK
jgi:hypothetical protein